MYHQNAILDRFKSISDTQNTLKWTQLAPRWRLGTSKEPPRQPKYEPSGAKDPQREQGVVHSQPRVLQNDTKYSKKWVPGYLKLEKTHTEQSETQPNSCSCSSQTPRIQLPSWVVTPSNLWKHTYFHYFSTHHQNTILDRFEWIDYAQNANQKRNLIHVHPRLQEYNYRLEVGGRGVACKFAAPL